MPQTTTDLALVAIAVALWLQTVFIIAVGLSTWRTSRRVHELLAREAEVLRQKLDDTMVEVRAAARALTKLGAEAEHAAAGAQRAVDDLRGAVRVAASAVTAPKTLLLAGLSAGARTLFSHWRARR